MSGILIDSDILIEVLRERNRVVLTTWMKVVSSAEPLFYSPVSVAEIRHGMRPGETNLIDRLFSAMICLPIGEEVASLAGDYLRAFHRSHGVELADAFIAATAIIHSLRLWSQNHKHFPMKQIELFPYE